MSKKSRVLAKGTRKRRLHPERFSGPVVVTREGKRTWTDDRPSFVYVVSDPRGYVKIGYSYKPRKRLVGLQVGQPVRLSLKHCLRLTDENVAKLVEGATHRALERWAVRGEWFETSVGHAVGEIDRAIEAVERVAGRSIRRPDDFAPRNRAH